MIFLQAGCRVIGERGATEPLPCGAESGKRLLVLLSLHFTSAFAVALKPSLVPFFLLGTLDSGKASKLLQPLLYGNDMYRR